MSLDGVVTLAAADMGAIGHWDGARLMQGADSAAFTCAVTDILVVAPHIPRACCAGEDVLDFSSPPGRKLPLVVCDVTSEQVRDCLEDVHIEQMHDCVHVQGSCPNALAHRIAVRLPDARVTLPGTDASRIRLRAVIMRPIKPDEAMSVFTLASNAVQQHIVSSDETLASRDRLLDGIFYDDTGNTRSQFNWAHVAIWVSSRCQRAGIDVDSLCEPVRSYVHYWRQLQAFRCGDVAEPPGKPSFPQAPRPTPQQIEHARSLFYWACIHADAPTRPASVPFLLKALSLYGRMGLVITRKRGYEFRSPCAKRRRPACTSNE